MSSNGETKGQASDDLEKICKGILEDVFGKVDSLARACAIFEAETVAPRYRDGDESPEEFSPDLFNDACEKLSYLAIMRELINLFELEDYEAEIMKLYITDIFLGKVGGSKNNLGQAVFKGNQEKLLEYYATRLM